MAYDFDQYYDLREDFIYTLGNQYSVNTDSNPYDPTGQISRMASRGDAKSKILELLEANSVYRKNKQLLESTDEVDDPIEEAVLLLFKELEQAVAELGDPPTPINVREMAADALESVYKGSESAAQMIRDGASSADVFKALDEVESWSNALEDYMTKDYVENTQNYQINRWATFADLVDIIRDTDLYK
jgi:hypothetical protein